MFMTLVNWTETCSPESDQLLHNLTAIREYLTFPFALSEISHHINQVCDVIMVLGIIQTAQGEPRNLLCLDSPRREKRAKSYARSKVSENKQFFHDRAESQKRQKIS